MSILVKPLITEKMTEQGETQNKFGFIVDRNATKPEIRKALEEFYGIEIDSLNTMIVPGKSKTNRRTGQVSGRSKIYKKAIFTLKEGFSLDFFESI